MEENKNPGINDAFLWGINVTVNDKTYSNKDLIVMLILFGILLQEKRKA